MFRCNQQCTPFIDSEEKYWGAETKNIKNLSPSAKKPVGTWYFTSAHNCDTILNINHLTRTWNFTSLPYKIVRRLTFFEKFDAVFYQETMLSSGVFRRETARGFYPWGKVDSHRKRVAEGLRGWRHGNSFPMAQSAQSLCQMRSIPRCSKAVFYVFVFDSIHDSTTMQDIPRTFPLSP